MQTTMTAQQYQREIDRMHRRLSANGLVLSNADRTKLESYLQFLLKEHAKLTRVDKRA